MNAVPATTGQPTVADVSKGSLQSSFASVIGAAVAATKTSGDTKLGKAQNVEAKKTSSPESSKKTPASTSDVASIAPPLVTSAVLVNVPVPVILQVVAPQADGSPAKESVGSTDTPAALGTSVAEVVPTISTTVVASAPKVVLPATVPAVADSNSGSSATSSVQDNSSSAIGTPTVGAAGATPPKSETRAASTPAPIASPVYTPFNTKASVDAATASNAPVDNASASPSTQIIPAFNAPVRGGGAVDSGKIGSVDAIPTSVIATASPNEKIGAQVGSVVAALQESLPLPVAIPAQATIVPTTSGGTSATVKGQSANEAALASKANISSGTVKQIGETAVSGAPVSSAVAADTLKSTSDAVKTSQLQIGTVSVSPAPTSAQLQASAAQTDAIPASAPQLVDASVAASTQQAGAQQANVIALTVPQQTAVQSVDAPVVTSSTSTFKVTAGKSDAVGTPGQFSIAAKGRTSVSDLRSNRTSASGDDKSSSTETVSGTPAARVVGPEVVSKELAGNFKGAMESATLTQNAQSAQVAGQTASTPAPAAASIATPDSSAATNSALPAHAGPAESTQAAQALNSAQLIQSVHGSEMRLGMNSAEFGNISINTSINHQTLSAQISMEHSALGSALAMHLPAIEEKLGSAYGLQAKVELRDTASNSAASDSSSNQSSGDRRSQGDSTGRPTAGPQSSIGALTSSNSTSLSTSTSMSAGTSRLDIRI